MSVNFEQIFYYLSRIGADTGRVRNRAAVNAYFHTFCCHPRAGGDPNLKRVTHDLILDSRLRGNNKKINYFSNLINLFLSLNGPIIARLDFLISKISFATLMTSGNLTAIIFLSFSCGVTSGLPNNSKLA